jgi:hypothetical protein
MLERTESVEMYDKLGDLMIKGTPSADTLSPLQSPLHIESRAAGMQRWGSGLSDASLASSSASGTKRRHMRATTYRPGVDAESLRTLVDRSLARGRKRAPTVEKVCSPLPKLSQRSSAPASSAQATQPSAGTSHILGDSAPQHALSITRTRSASRDMNKSTDVLLHVESATQTRAGERVHTTARHAPTRSASCDKVKGEHSLSYKSSYSRKVQDDHDESSASITRVRSLDSKMEDLTKHQSKIAHPIRSSRRSSLRFEPYAA